MRPFLLLPLVTLAACASTSPQDLQKMSAVDVCYTGMMEPEKQAIVQAELNRRNENCDKYAAELKKMADMEVRAGGSGPNDPKSVGAPSMTGGGMGGMGRY